MIPSFLINLDRSADRLEFISKRLQDLGVSYTRIAAVDGTRLSEEDRAAFIAERPRDGRTWSAGQIGCFQSHMQAWRKIADGDAPFGFVIEDDIHLSDDIVEFLSDTSWIPEKAAVVRLETTGQWLELDKDGVDVKGRSLRRVQGSAWGAGAYILRKVDAQWILSVQPGLHSPVDDFLFNFWGSKLARSLNTYQINPALAEQDKFKANQSRAKGFGSGIETAKVNKRLSVIGAARRAITSTIRGKTRIAFR